MKWVGLTGGIGTGKSTVAGLIRKMGLPVLDADQFARDVVNPGTEGLMKLVQRFGLSILDKNQSLDRQKLAALVFSDPNAKKDLETILHPLIRKKTSEEKEKLISQGYWIAFYDVPLLFETQMADLFDATIVVTCDPDLQIDRLKKRNGWNEEEIQTRIKSQMPLSEKEKMATYLIQNNEDIEKLQIQINQIISQVKKHN